MSSLDKSIKSLSKEQLESLAKIINLNIDNSKKMYLMGKVFEGEKINIIDAEGEEYKSISSTIAGTTLSIENGFNPGIREVIDKGKEDGKSPYESLKKAGYIKNPMDEFYINLGKREVPSVSDLINEIKKVDTPEAIRLVKNLEENTIEDEEI